MRKGKPTHEVLAALQVDLNTKLKLAKLKGKIE